MSYCRDPFYIYRSGHEPCGVDHTHEEFNFPVAEVEYDALAVLLANMADRHNDELAALIERGKALDQNVSPDLIVMALWRPAPPDDSVGRAEGTAK